MSMLGPTKVFPTMVQVESSEVREPWHVGSHTHYTYDFKSKKEPPDTVIKWCRRNFGAREDGWTFYLSGGKLVIEIWKDKYKMMYELWHR